MIDRLYKAYCYWRENGFADFLNLLLLTIKAGGKPVILPGTGGAPNVGEVDKGSVRDIVGRRFPICSPLQVFSAPGTDRRISIVTDSINSGTLYGGVGTAIIIAVLLAEAIQARLRIVTRSEKAQPANLEHILATYGLAVVNDVEFAFAPSYDYRYEIDYLKGEIFMTTSWWTTASTMASIPHSSILYLLQEDERMFYAFGDEHLRCSSVLRSAGIKFLINSRLLYDHFVNEGFDNIVKNGMFFEPAFPREVFHPSADRNRDKKTLLFYARPNNQRNLFYFGIELLEESIARGIIDLAQWNIVFVGKDVPKIILGGGYQPEVRENLAWGDYAKLIGKVDLGLCLMYTPHPSYPPLDLAASGAVVVTNRFANKTDLSAYSKNIICGDLNRDAMLETLRMAMDLTLDQATRDRNFRESTLGRCWRESTANIIKHVAESF